MTATPYEVVANRLYQLFHGKILKLVEILATPHNDSEDPSCDGTVVTLNAPGTNAFYLRVVDTDEEQRVTSWNLRDEQDDERLDGFCTLAVEYDPEIMEEELEVCSPCPHCQDLIPESAVLCPTCMKRERGEEPEKEEGKTMVTEEVRQMRADFDEIYQLLEGEISDEVYEDNYIWKAMLVAKRHALPPVTLQDLVKRLVRHAPGPSASSADPYSSLAARKAVDYLIDSWLRRLQSGEIQFADFLKTVAKEIPGTVSELKKWEEHVIEQAEQMRGLTLDMKMLGTSE